METVKDTLSQAATTLGLTGAQKEEHESMIDGKVRTGTPGQGHQDNTTSKDFASQPEGPIPGQKPQGANVVGEDNLKQTDKPMSNKDEPNTGFGGGSGAAQPSVDAKPARARDDAGSGSIGGGMGGGVAGGTGMKLPHDNNSHSEGTGTKHVKSSGLKADGGDFDASRPGAGMEADRIMDQKGIHHGAVDKSSSVEDSGNSQSDHSKGFADKIKEKLHH